jgi:hypothetical protein
MRPYSTFAKPSPRPRDARLTFPIHPSAWKVNFPKFAGTEFYDVRIGPRSYAEQRFYLRGGEFATTERKKRIMPFEGRPSYSSVAWPIGPGCYAPCATMG